MWDTVGLLVVTITVKHIYSIYLTSQSRTVWRNVTCCLIVGIQCVGLASLRVLHSGRQLECECAVHLRDVGPRQVAAPCSQRQDARQTGCQLHCAVCRAV
jgi:hypothetical protein